MAEGSMKPWPLTCTISSGLSTTSSVYFKCVYMLKDYPLFKESDFEYLRGKIQVLLPEKDIFKKEDQDRLAELFRKLDAEILNAPGGHVGFIVQSECYMDLMETFLRKAGI